MATIVVSKETGDRYVLLGTGFGMFQSKIGNKWFHQLVPETEEGQQALACICDGSGELGWAEYTSLRVVSVDGVAVGDCLT